MIRTRMPLGRRIRQALGPLERPASELYRSLFIDLDRVVDRIAAWAPATRILEIGCGDGVLTERLARRYPQAQIHGIDVADEPGRQFRGDHTRVTFHRENAEAFCASCEDRFDLVVLCDVLHHVLPDERPAILRSARRALAPGGGLVLKEWQPTATPIHGLTYLLEVGLGGAFTRYETAGCWRALLADHFDASANMLEEHIGPWRNNVLFLVPTRERGEVH